MRSFLLFIVAAGLASGAHAQIMVLGSKPEVLDTDLTATAPPLLTQASFSLNSGESRIFGPGPLRSSAGHTYKYYWSCQEGVLEALNAENSHVRYVAPLLSGSASDRIYVWIGSTSGRVTEGIIDVTVLPTSSAPPLSAGQLTSSYMEATGSFLMNYSLNAATTLAGIFSSLDGQTWTQVLAIDPVTPANRSGSVNVNVAGSGATSSVYFRLRAQEGSAAALNGNPITVSYIPTPTEPKSTELPVAPRLVINGWQVARPSVEMFWSRVNDSLLRDNAIFYEVQRALNPEFAGGMVENVANTAPGLNLFENLFHTSAGLSDDTTYFFRVRAVNHVGAGLWSETRSIRVNIQDVPVFDLSNPVFPAHGATGVSKIPALEVSVADPEGDAFYCAFEISESPTGPWRYFGHGGQQDYRNVTRLDPGEWATALKPNTHYFWRAIVHEEGRNLDYYGGVRPTSPVWEFTTEDVGGAYSITQIQHVSGALKTFEHITYRVTVTNNGNGPASPNFVEALYVKNGIAHPFLYNAPGQLPALNPGESVSVDVTVYFRDAPFTASNGVTYDNALTTGPSVIRFRTGQDEGTVGVASLDHPINYVNQGGPTFNLLVRGPTSNNPNAPAGGYFEIIAGITDDIRATRALIEYRANPASPWQFLDEFTGNTNPWFSFQTTSHIGNTVPGSQNSTTWHFPGSWSPTSTLQVRLTAFDDVGAYSVAVSNPMTIYDDSLVVNAGAVQFPSYRLGDVALLPLIVNTPMLVNSLSVDYVYGSSTLRIYNQVDANGVEVPPVLAVTLPSQEAFVNSSARLRVQVTATIPGVVQRTASDESDGTFAVRMPDLPAPFNSAVTLFSENYSFPPGSLHRQETAESVALDWEADSIVHAVVRRYHAYNLSETYSGTPEFSGDECFHVRYNRVNGFVDQIPLPAGYLCDDVKVIGATPHFLLRSGNNLYLTSRSANSFVSPQFLTSVDGIAANYNPELMKRGSELYLTWQANTSQPGANWRHRLKKVLPSMGSDVEHSFRIDGNHLDYGSHLNTPQGLYSLNSDLSAGSAVVTWPFAGNGARFTSLSSGVAGMRFGYQANHFMDVVSPAGGFTRWDALVYDPVVKVFNDVALSIGKGTTQGLPGEDNRLVAIRRNQATGMQERVIFGDPGIDAFSSIQRRISITDSKWMAAAWRKQLAVGYFGGDLTAPTVQITTEDASYVPGQPKTLEWTLSDNLSQLSGLKVFQVAAGVSTEIASYSGSIPSSLTHSFSASSSLIFRLEAFDQAGNVGVAEKILSQNSNFTLDSFTAATYSIPVGVPVALQWASTPEDAFRVYTLLIRPQGTTEWTQAGSHTGNSCLLETTLLTGATEVRVQSGAVSRDLPQPIVVTGTIFAFFESQAGPASGTTYYSPTSPVISLSWDSNQGVSPAVLYTVLGRWDGAGAFQLLGTTSDKRLEGVDVTGHSSLEWRVVAQWEGQEFISTSKSIVLSGLPEISAPQVVLGGAATALPFVDVSWSAVAGIEGYVLYRRDGGSDEMVELVRTESPTFRDESIRDRGVYSYSVGTIWKGEASQPGLESTIQVELLLPLGIQFLNPKNEILSGNTNTVRWTLSLPPGATEVFQSYDIVLRKGDGAIARLIEHNPEAGAGSEIVLSGLAFSQGYVLEIWAKDINGEQIASVPARLHFSTGFDTRTISGGPVVHTLAADEYGFYLSWNPLENADYYDIFRRSTTASGMEWVGRSTTTEFRDSSDQWIDGATYVIRARNGLMNADSVETQPLLLPFASSLDGVWRAWRTGGNVPWRVEESLATKEGVSSVTSGILSDTEQSWLETTVTGPLTVTFWCKTSSESDHDFLRFLCSGREQFTISGEVDWEQRTVAVPRGVHTLRWIYEKDANGAKGGDRAWLDQVRFVRSSAPVLSIKGSKILRTARSSVLVKGTATDADGDLAWVRFKDSRRGGARWRSVSGTASWRANAVLKPGKNNSVQIRAGDAAGFYSKMETVRILRR